MKRIILPKQYRQKMINLKTYGNNEFAWKKKDALNLLNEIFLQEASILGGDVIEFIDKEKINPTYDNWSIEKSNFKSEEEFATKSKTISKEYINTYHENNRNIIYSITFNYDIDEFNYLDFDSIHWSFGGVIDSEDYPLIACEAISKGENHPAILELATLHKPTLDEVHELLKKFYAKT